MWNDRIEQTEELRRRHYLGGGQARIDRQHGHAHDDAHDRGDAHAHVREKPDSRFHRK